MRCWICGEPADSGEHMIKASDLRALFANVTQKTPIYFHNSERRNQAVGGIKSDKLKYRSRVCSKCNNERTQPHDRAWEQLSGYLRSRQPPLQKGTRVRLNRVFPGTAKRSMLGVHLYFVKLFGCLIAEHSIPLDLSAFSSAILRDSPHPKVHLAFWVGLGDPARKHVARSHVQTASLGGTIVYAGWFYSVHPVSVNVIYSEATEHRKGLVHAWHPTTVGRYVQRIRIDRAKPRSIRLLDEPGPERWSASLQILFLELPRKHECRRAGSRKSRCAAAQRAKMLRIRGF
jgi:hypothetical protein